LARRQAATASETVSELSASEIPKLCACMGTMAQRPWRANHAWKMLREVLATWERPCWCQEVFSQFRSVDIRTLYYLRTPSTTLESAATDPALMASILQGTEILKLFW